MKYHPKDQNPHRYDDMLSMPPHKSLHHAPMSMENRAAQFSPFAALTGFEAEIEETARLTEEKRELTEEAKAQLNHRLMEYKAREEEQPLVNLTYFQPDEKKEGGSYQTEEVRIRKVDTDREVLRLTDGREIKFTDLI